MLNKKRIYLADDEPSIREAIKTFLLSEGYDVYAFENGDLLFQYFLQNPCDLIILDVMMPGSSGFIITQEIRKISTVPIIILTAKDSDLDYATGLSLGSDDYFTKPFSAMSLVMRVKSIFRRIDFEKQNHSGDQEYYQFLDLELNNLTKTTLLNKQEIALTPNEFNLLKYLIQHQNQAVSRDQLLAEVWGIQSDIETKATDDTVRRLRKKIINSQAMIEAVWGYGFKLRRKS